MEMLQEKNKITFFGLMIAVFAFLSPLESFLGSSAGSILKLYTVACIGIFALMICAKRTYRLVTTSQLLLIIFFLIIIISALCSPQFSRAIDYLFSIGLQIVLILTATQVCYSQKDRNFILYGYIIGCIVLAALVIANASLMEEGTRVSAETEEGVVDPNNVAAYLVAGAAAAMTVRLEWKFFSPVRWLCLILFVIATLMTASRGGFLSLGVFALYYAFSQKNARRTLGSILLIGVLAWVVIWLSGSLFGDNNPIDLLQNRFEEDSSGSGRLELWGIAVDAILEKPIFGHGLANSPYVVGKTYISTIGVHNTYLTFWMECGIFAIIILVSIYVSLWNNKNKNDSFHRAVFGILLTTMVSSFFFDTYNKKVFWLPLLLCMIAITSDKYQGEMVPLEENSVEGE